MEKMELSEFIDEFLIACDFVDEVSVNADSRLDEIADFDSLAMLGVIIMMETRFSRRITAEKVFELATVGALYAYSQEQV
ncbi:acyl carrier protein [Bordetella avium]|nr:acyl carrier protein [Bordetella avium]AZY50423.1 acyl carrier protein [Bordetella avium]AZY53819.1 acyl carrier protein [Bordetella avium]RIQ15636.1 acyl carrier protein [Bordetella avium]RIQ19785.1 acyl carrier protein [Bordetella avium]RIQ34366.1 acyl carrier protein [Bordetella avium]